MYRESDSKESSSYYEVSTRKYVEADNNALAVLRGFISEHENKFDPQWGVNPTQEQLDTINTAIKDVEFAINNIDFRQTVIDMVNLEASTIQDGEVEILEKEEEKSNEIKEIVIAGTKLNLRFLTKEARIYIETRVTKPKTGEMYTLESENLEEAIMKFSSIYEKAEAEGTQKEDLHIQLLDKEEALQYQVEISEPKTGYVGLLSEKNLIELEHSLRIVLADRFAENKTLSMEEVRAIIALFHNLTPTPPQGGEGIGELDFENLTQKELDDYLESFNDLEIPAEKVYYDYEYKTFEESELRSEPLPTFEEIEQSILENTKHHEAKILEAVEEDALQQLKLISFNDEKHYIELFEDEVLGYVIKAEAGEEVTYYQTHSPISASRKINEIVEDFFYHIAEKIENHEEDSDRASALIEDLKTLLLEEGVGLGGTFDKFQQNLLRKALISC